MLKDYILQQLALITEYYEGNTVEENADGSITLITTVFFDRTYVTVKKSDGEAGWTKKVDHQNGYSVSFQITPISDDQINIEVFSRGIIANAMLRSRYIDGEKSWVFDNFNRSLDSWYASEYPYIQFTNSFNKSNQFTGFIAYTIDIIKKCLNDEPLDYTDDNDYNEVEYKNTAPDGDLILTIREDTWRILRKKAQIQLSNGTQIPITEKLIGKKIIRRDSDTTRFYPLNEDDFKEYKYGKM